MARRYSSITIIRQEEILPVEIEVEYSDGSRDTIVASDATKSNLNNECYQAIKSFAEQEGSGYDIFGFIENSGKVTRRGAPRVGSDGSRETHGSSSDGRGSSGSSDNSRRSRDNSERNPKKDKDSKKKKKKGFLKRLLCFLINLMLLMGGYRLIRKGLGSSATFTLTTQGYTTSSSSSTFDDRIDGYIADGGLLSFQSDDASNQTELDEILSIQSALAWKNVTEISNFVNGRDLSGQLYYPSFVDLYEENTYDYYAVERFNLMRNNVVSSAYNSRDVNQTVADLQNFGNAFVQFVFGNKAYSTEFGQYTFDDLSPSAKITIIEMGTGMFMIEHDSNYQVRTQDGRNTVFTREEIISMLDQLKRDAYNDLMAQQTFGR